MSLMAAPATHTMTGRLPQNAHQRGRGLYNMKRRYTVKIVAIYRGSEEYENGPAHDYSIIYEVGDGETVSELCERLLRYPRNPQIVRYVDTIELRAVKPKD